MHILRQPLFFCKFLYKKEQHSIFSEVSRGSKHAERQSWQNSLNHRFNCLSSNAPAKTGGGSVLLQEGGTTCRMRCPSPNEKRSFIIRV